MWIFHIWLSDEPELSISAICAFLCCCCCCCIVALSCCGLYVYIIKLYQQRMENRWAMGAYLCMHTKQMPFLLLLLWGFVFGIELCFDFESTEECLQRAKSLWNVQEIVINYNIMGIFMLVWENLWPFFTHIFRIFISFFFSRSFILQQCQRK